MLVANVEPADALLDRERHHPTCRVGRDEGCELVESAMWNSLIPPSAAADRVFRLLEAFGPVDWGRISVGETDQGHPMPPVVVVRYVKPDDAIRLVSATRQFQGSVSWTIDDSHRNHVIWPTEVETRFLAEGWRTDAELRDHMARTEQEFSTRCATDFMELVSHLEDCAHRL